MPPTGSITPEEVADLKTWIDQGAHWASDKETPTSADGGKYAISPEQKAFWSFQPLQKTILPRVKDVNWPKSEIDYYILAKLEERGLRPVEQASKRQLIRRATFDLIGLPPDPKDVDAFLGDSSAEAFATVVDRLLASPHFGERWGRHWLDIARYGEDDPRGIGVEKYPNAYHYRDWVIDAFNKDIPYNLFVKAQIAGDLLDKEDQHALKPALGFFALGPWYYDIAMPPQARANERDDRVDALTRGFLGLTVACARCHDHKYDPIPTTDYYALAGVFASSDYREYPLVTPSKVEAYKEHKKAIERQEQVIKEFLQTAGDQLTEILSRKISRYMMAAWNVLGPPKAELSQAAAHEGLDQVLLERWVQYLGPKERDHPFLDTWDGLLAKGAVEEKVREFAESFQTQAIRLMADKAEVDEENRRARSQIDLSKAKVIAPNGYKGFHCPLCDVTGTSLERDRWVLWAELFSVKLRETGDRGRTGGILRLEGDVLGPFLHPEWKSHAETLRAELQKLKDSSPEPYPFLMVLADSEDPGDLRLHIRGSPDNLGDPVPRRFLTILSNNDPVPFSEGSGRLELAEAIIGQPLAARVMVNRVWQHLMGQGIVRTPNNFGQVGDRPSHPQLLDSLALRLQENGGSMKSLIREIMLSATYLLSSSSNAHNLKEEPGNRLFWRAHRRRLDAEALRDGILYVSGSLDLARGGPSAELTEENTRRTVYGTISRFKIDDKLALFDFPSPSITSDQRSVTNVPLQRLFFLNSELILIEAGKLAERLAKEAGAGDRERIQKAYEILFSREAAAKEIEMGLDYLRSVRSEEAEAAWPRYAQMLLASTEFSYVD